MSINYTYDLYLKAVLVGDAGVGKTCLWHRILHGEFSEQYVVTICADIQPKDFQIDDRYVRLTLMDTAGQEKYRYISDLYFKDKDIVILTFDLSSSSSFDSLCKDWIYEIANYCDPKKSRLLILGNKLDIGQKSLQTSEIISRLESIDRCKLYNLENDPNFQAKVNDKEHETDHFGYLYAEISAKTGQNVNSSMEKIISIVANERLKNKSKARAETDFGNSQIFIDGVEVKPKESQSSKRCC